MRLHVPQHLCRGWWTTCSSGFSPSPTWDLKADLSRQPWRQAPLLAQPSHWSLNGHLWSPKKMCPNLWWDSMVKAGRSQLTTLPAGQGDNDWNGSVPFSTDAGVRGPQQGPHRVEWRAKHRRQTLTSDGEIKGDSNGKSWTLPSLKNTPGPLWDWSLSFSPQHVFRVKQEMTLSCPY